MNFDDIKPGSFVPLITGYGITGEFPIDLRSIVNDLQMLQAMIDAHWLYEGLLVYNKNDKKYYQIYINGSGVLDYKLFEIEASQVQQAVESDHLSHTVTINGVGTTFADDTLNINRLVPQQIVNYSDLDNTTNTGQYYGNDGQNNYLLTIEAIGDDKLIRTMTTIENDRVVIKKAIATKINDEWIWGEWTVADGSIASAFICLFDTYVSVAAAAGTVNERWIYSTAGSEYPANKTEIHTNDGQVFTLQGTAPAAVIAHPFVVKLHSNGVTKTATVESLAATGSNPGLVTLSESINDNTHGANSGVAASPKAVASLNSAKANTNHKSSATTYGVGNSTEYGHLKLSDATNSDSAASAGVAASPKAVKAVKDSNSLLAAMFKEIDCYCGETDSEVTTGQITVNWVGNAPTTTSAAILIRFNKAQPQYNMSAPPYIRVGTTNVVMISASGAAAGSIFKIGDSWYPNYLQPLTAGKFHIDTTGTITQTPLMRGFNSYIFDKTDATAAASGGFFIRNSATLLSISWIAVNFSGQTPPDLAIKESLDNLGNTQITIARSTSCAYDIFVILKI